MKPQSHPSTFAHPAKHHLLPVAAIVTLVCASTLSGAPRQSANQPPQYIEKSYPAPPGNQWPDKNAQMQMHAKQGAGKNFEAANLERKRQIETDTAELLKLAKELKSAVDKTDRDTLSIEVIRKAELIEKLAHGVKEKMKLTVSTTALGTRSTSLSSSEQ
jgi:hypothetical protein